LAIVNKELYQHIVETLWPRTLSPRTMVCAMVDSARDERIFGAVDFTKQQKDCLYAGDLPWQLQMTAPYLVELSREERFTRFILENGWGDGWVSFIRTETGFKQLRKHLRQFLRVRTEDNKRLIFRYYDPRILRVYLPTCRPAELETFFGPVDSFLTESDGGDEILEFQRDGKVMHIAFNGTAPV
jgi:hypothetical protein